MAASVIDEAVRNNVSVGGRRISLLDNFTWGNPEYEDRLGGLVLASRACYDIGKVYGTPFVSGKDSLYNESPLGPVTPTLLITALGIVPDIRKAVTMDLKEAGNSLYIVGTTKPELGGSEYYALHGELGASVPKLEPEKNTQAYARLNEAMDRGIVRACHDLSDGGLGVAAAEMAFTGGLGLGIDLSKVPISEKMRDDFTLYSESNGRLLVEVKEKDCGEFEALMFDSVFARIGSVKEVKTLRVQKNGETLVELPLEILIGVWKTPLEDPR
jgi:phosphoribosylformylglycinamidine synthase